MNLRRPPFGLTLPEGTRPPLRVRLLKWEMSDEIDAEVVHGADARGELRRAGARPGHAEGGRRRRRPGQHHRLGGLYRARRDRQELRLGDRVREGERLQGQRQDRRHLGRDGGADERGRLRPRHRVGRRLAAADRRQARAAGQCRSDQELVDCRRSTEGRPVVHGGRRALRRALPVGAERADVQHRGVQGGAEELERRLRGDGPAGRQVQQGPRAGL